MRINFNNILLSKMKAILVREFGGPEVCQIVKNVPIPEPNDNQIQIKVHATGVNPVDTYIRSGTHSRQPKLPYTPGLDSAGIVTKVGKNVKKFKVGDRVFTVNSDTGTYAEYTLSTPISTFRLEDNLSFEEGSSLGVPYFSAYRALFIKANAKPGETLLIHGASGSVGIATIQFAKTHGLKIIGTAGTKEGMELVKEQGADYVYNHKENDYMEKVKHDHPEGIDIILEMLANVNLNNDLQILKAKKGRVVVIGNRGTIDINPRLLMAKETSVTGVTLFSSTEEEFEMMNSHLQALIKNNCIKPVIGKVFTLEETPEAQSEVINNAGTFGRITIKVV